MTAVSTLGMTPARRRIFEAGISAQREMSERCEAEARRERERRIASAPIVPLWRRIVREVAAKHGIDAVEMMDKRFSQFCAARHEVFYRIADETDLTWGEIGHRLDRHHSSAIKGAQRHAERNGLPALVGLRGREIQVPRGRGRAPASRARDGEGNS